MHNRICLALIFLSVFTISLFAEPKSLPDTNLQTLNLEECVETALQNNPQISISKQKVLAAKAKKKEMIANYLPYISGSLTYIKRNDIEGAESLSSLTSLSPMFRLSFANEMYDSKLSLNQTVFAWGRNYYLNKQASLSRTFEEEDFRRNKNEIIYKVKESFYRYILGKELVTISQEAYDVTQRHLKVTEKFYDQGRSSSYDVSRAKVSLANAKTNLIKAENGLKLAKQSLINVINIKKSDIDFSGNLEYTAVEKNLDELTSAALQNRPEISQIGLQEKMTRALKKITLSGDKPNILLSAYTEWQNTDFSADNVYNTWTAMAILNIPIFDGFSTYQKTKQMDSSIEQVRLTKYALIEGVKLEVNAAFLNFQQAKDSIEANKENVNTAKDNLQTAQKRYELGLMSDIEVRDAQLSLTQAELNYTQSLYDYNTALAAMDRAVGK